MRAAISVTALLLLLSPALAGNPFDGWDAPRIAKHEKAARLALGSRVRAWCAARSTVVNVCNRCEGSGEIYRLTSDTRVTFKTVLPCDTCFRSGARIRYQDFQAVLWEIRSPAYRAEPQRWSKLGDLHAKATVKPRSLPELSRVTRSLLREFRIHGNFATVVFDDYHGRTRHRKTVEMIEVRGEWYLAHETADREFERHAYPGREEETAEAEPEDAPPPEEAWFAVSRLKVTHAEGDAYQVQGRVKNVTTGQRFRYVIVRVALVKGSEVLLSCRCHLGDRILEPGDDAPFIGYVYFEKRPRFSRVEGKVSKFEEVE